MRPYPSSYLESGERPDDSPPPYDVIVFDCDSTLSNLEGIDSLAENLSGEDAAAISAMTIEAMGGEKSLQEVYGERLERIRPNRADVEALGQRYIAGLLPSAREVIAALKFLGKEVHVLSGGLEPGVKAVAAELGIEPANVHAVGIFFDEDGNYAGFDTSSPLAREGGKPEVVAALRGDREVALVGDGTTDIEASPELARFVAFGAVVKRDVVFQLARVHATDTDLVQLLPLLCSGAELDRIDAEPAFADLL
ncbi:MAG: HAD-IB family phosphatase [Planctomycetota bacterium]|nr:HAD-IB family phosphatase [Planctomycetota bacterium]